jgi:N-terminal domain of (some) glycogen debranching enzymes
MAEEQLIILDGTTFFYSDHCGDVEAEEAEGFFYRDVRHLSRWLLFIDGKRLEPLTSRRVDYFSLRIVGGPKTRHPSASPATASSPRASMKTWSSRT